MVYGFVQQAHGEILVDSAVGIGTTFRILLPIATGCPDAVAPAAAPPPSVDRRRATVLVVEDDADVREISSQILTRLGYVVLTARDGREALALAETHAGTLECVISDLIMPGQSGVAVVGLLRARWPALRVLYVSGYDDDAIVRHGGSSSDGAFLRKPFTPEALAIAVDHALAGVPTVA
jgi:CheY-like chemotaxis protein